MAEHVVHVRASRAQIRRLVLSLPDASAGGRSEAGNLVKQMLIRLGMTLLGRIKRAFIVKAAGGTDESGLRWKPLSPSTIAYKRRHPGLPPPARRASKRPSAALTGEQRQEWWGHYRKYLAVYKGDEPKLTDEADGKSHAAAMAWFLMKQKGVQTLLDKYGNVPVQILRDTGLLLNSLSPGVEDPATATAIPRIPEQVFRVGRRDVIVGTSRKGAKAHHTGQGRPKRPLWPEPRDWPASWWDELLEQAKLGVVDVLLYLLGRI